MTTSNWTEEEWAVTIERAAQDPHRATGMLSEPPRDNSPLPLGEGDIDALYLLEQERRIAEYNARALNWMLERINGRNTP